MLFEKYDLFEKNKYFNECHSAGIVEMPNRSLVVSFFAGTREKARDVGTYIVKKKIVADKTEWTQPKLFFKDPKRSMGTGYFFIPPGKKEIWLYYNLMQGSGWSTCNIAYHVFKDGSWSERKFIKRMIGWVSRGKILVLKNGDFFMPLHDELLGYKAYFKISTDGGKRWKNYGPIKTRKGCLEPSVVQIDDGRLYCILRTKEREVFESWSHDNGRRWSQARPTGIPNPDSQEELLYLSIDYLNEYLAKLKYSLDKWEKKNDNHDTNEDIKGVGSYDNTKGTRENLIHLLENNIKRNKGIILMFNNHSKESRSPLSIYYSLDYAKTWSAPINIQIGKGEFSYPNAVLGSDGHIHLVFTNKRKTIRYVKMDLEWVINNNFI
ncbi:MAG: exo-alpha-sialidase [Promethearchaeota archaeon]